MGLDSDTQSITISCKTSPSGKLKTIENVLDALRESLLGSEPFVLVPIDCISNISNIKPLFERHLARADAAKNAGGDPVVFTAVVQRDDRTLRHALNALMKSHQSYTDFSPDLLKPDTSSTSGMMVPGGHSDYVDEASLVTAESGVEADGLLGDLQEERRTEYLWGDSDLSLIHISEPTRLLSISYAVFCLKKKNQTYCLRSILSHSLKITHIHHR
eukprot:TRINITY_DN52128_c0_g1_i1.p1 TRINITY_DN52128_c0_g1~~TRINITY_DN52128_c0_g1_i1.p1  ORF type:complete len:216 (+),score=53.44 TRINITY_DN52128_c0_g1_i1:186-833(+)